MESQLNDIIKNTARLSAISTGRWGAFSAGPAFGKGQRGLGKRLIDATVYQHQFADLYTAVCGWILLLLAKDRMKRIHFCISDKTLYDKSKVIEIEEIIRLMISSNFGWHPIDRYLKDAKTIEIYENLGIRFKRIAARWIKEEEWQNSPYRNINFMIWNW